MNHAYRIRRNDKWGYDEYDAAVVIAESPEQALAILIKGYGTGEWDGWGNYDVSIEKLSLDEPRIVLASYNAG